VKKYLAHSFQQNFITFSLIEGLCQINYIFKEFNWIGKKYNTTFPKFQISVSVGFGVIVLVCVGGGWQCVYV
jgi:hypothetical protein